MKIALRCSNIELQSVDSESPIVKTITTLQSDSTAGDNSVNTALNYLVFHSTSEDSPVFQIGKNYYVDIAEVPIR